LGTVLRDHFPDKRARRTVRIGFFCRFARRGAISLCGASLGCVRPRRGPAAAMLKEFACPLARLRRGTIPAMASPTAVALPRALAFRPVVLPRAVPICLVAGPRPLVVCGGLTAPDSTVSPERPVCASRPPSRVAPEPREPARPRSRASFRAAAFGHPAMPVLHAPAHACARLWPLAVALRGCAARSCQAANLCCECCSAMGA
jgi:hypothetical protein